MVHVQRVVWGFTLDTVHPQFASPVPWEWWEILLEVAALAVLEHIAVKNPVSAPLAKQVHIRVMDFHHVLLANRASTPVKSAVLSVNLVHPGFIQRNDLHFAFPAA
jgi:hypothetical protein